MQWTFEQLRTFAAVADHGTMTAAAERLGYTTGAISQQMTALRTAIGRPLFTRSGRGLALTDTGRILLQHLPALLDSERRAAAAVSGPNDHQEMIVTLGVFGSAAVSAIRPVSEQLRADAPNVSVRAVEVDVEVMPQAVIDDRIDVALGLDYSDAPMAPMRGVVSTRLHREPFRMVLPPSAASLVDDPRALLAYANDTDWILPPLDSAFGKAARFACAASGIDPRVTHTVTDTAVSIAMAESGTGITLATPLMMTLHPTTSPLGRLTGGSTRDIVATVRTASLDRPSVAAVHNALVVIFARL